MVTNQNLKGKIMNTKINNRNVIVAYQNEDGVTMVGDIALGKKYVMDYNIMNPKSGFEGSFGEVNENLESTYGKSVNFVRTGMEIVKGWSEAKNITNFLYDYELSNNELHHKTRYTAQEFVTVLANFMIRGVRTSVKAEMNRVYSPAIVYSVVKSLKGNKKQKNAVDAMVCGYMHTKLNNENSSEFNTVLIKDVVLIEDRSLDLNSEAIEIDNNSLSLGNLIKKMSSGFITYDLVNRAVTNPRRTFVS